MPTSLYATWVSENIHIFKERRLLRFCLWLFKTSQLLISQSKNKATVDVYGVCYISLVHLCCVNIRCTLSLYIQRGLSSCCSFGLLGQCESLKQRTSNYCTDSRAFLFIWVNLNLIEPSCSGICGHNIKYYDG